MPRYADLTRKPARALAAQLDQAETRIAVATTRTACDCHTNPHTHYPREQAQHLQDKLNAAESLATQLANVLARLALSRAAHRFGNSFDASDR